MRLGWDDQNINAPELAQAAEALGAKAVTVHGRTRQQFYKGAADWTAIRTVVEAVGIPVVANGDIGGSAEAKRCLNLSRAAAVMVGRAAMGRPWHVGRIAAELEGRASPRPSPEAMVGAAIEHYEGLLGLMGRAVGIRHARKHLAAYADVAYRSGFGLCASDRERLVTSENPGEVARLLKNLYAAPVREAA
jgi:tRNA-dihydrouridine synthase B